MRSAAAASLKTFRSDNHSCNQPYGKCLVYILGHRVTRHRCYAVVYEVLTTPGFELPTFGETHKGNFSTARLQAIWRAMRCTPTVWRDGTLIRCDPLHWFAGVIVARTSGLFDAPSMLSLLFLGSV